MWKAVFFCPASRLFVFLCWGILTVETRWLWKSVLLFQLFDWNDQRRDWIKLQLHLQRKKNVSSQKTGTNIKYEVYVVDFKVRRRKLKSNLKWQKSKSEAFRSRRAADGGHSGHHALTAQGQRFCSSFLKFLSSHILNFLSLKTPKTLKLSQLNIQ